MKTLEPIQYQWLCAVERGNYLLASELSDQCPNGSELLNRGLYTYIPFDGNPDRYEQDSPRLTQAGRDAIMGYRAIIGEYSFT